jgi:hypothetical protein
MAGASAGAVRAGRAFVELFTDDRKLVAGLRAASAKLKSWGDSLSTVGRKLMTASAAVLTPLIGATKVFANLGSSLTAISERTGLSVKAIQLLSLAADTSDTSFEAVETALRRMQKAIQEARLGSLEAAETFRRLGLNLAALASLSPEQQFRAVADALARIEDPGQRAAMAMAVFGKSGTAILPMITEGSKSLDAVGDRLERVGYLSEKEVAAGARLAQDFTDAWRAVKVTFAKVGAALAPVLQPILRGLVGLLQHLRKWIDANQGVIRSVFAVASGVFALGASLFVGGKAMLAASAFLKGIAVILPPLRKAFSALLGIIKAIPAAIWGLAGMIATGAGYIAVATGLVQRSIETVAHAFRGLLNSVNETFAGIVDSLLAGDVELAAQIMGLGLKAAWIEATGALVKIWNDTKATFTAVWVAAQYEAAKAIVSAWYWLQEQWIKVTSAIRMFGLQATNTLKSYWDGAVTWIAKRLAELWALIDESVSAEDLKAELEADYRRREAQRNRELNQALGQASQERTQALSDIDKLRREMLGTLQQDEQRAIDRRMQEAAQRKRAVEKEISEAKGKLAEARRRAAEARQRAEAEEAVKPQFPQAPDLLEGLRRQTVGTFSYFAHQVLGTGTAERTARAAEATARNTAAIREELHRKKALEFS